MGYDFRCLTEKKWNKESDENCACHAKGYIQRNCQPWDWFRLLATGKIKWEGLRLSLFDKEKEIGTKHQNQFLQKQKNTKITWKFCNDDGACVLLQDSHEINRWPSLRVEILLQLQVASHKWIIL